MDCFLDFASSCAPLILWLTSSFAANYANVGTYEFKKVTKVRIALAPPRSLDCRENSLARRRNTRIMPVFRDYWQTNRTAENGLLGSKGATVLAFLWRAHAQSGFQ